ncbi:MAG TPA: hypothetical protein VFL66_04935 [Gaiellaceae bacterium]|nr:hypothetical protein [Gaiellaceae bacterium]
MEACCTVDAPDAFAAFVLAHDLDPWGDLARIEARNAGFRVAFETDDDGLARALRTVQHWLVDERIERTTVRFGERSQVLRAA